MKLIVAGSRIVQDKAKIFATLDAFCTREKPTEIVCGCCNGPALRTAIGMAALLVLPAFLLWHAHRLNKLEKNQDRMLAIIEREIDILSFINTNVAWRPGTPEMK